MNAIAPVTSAPALDAMIATIRAQEARTASWPDEQRQAADARAAAVDALNAEAFRRLIRGLWAVPEAAAALRKAVADELVYAVLRRHGILKPSLFERVEAALETIRPMLASHGGNVELVAVEPPLAKIRLLGACDGCPASALTFYSGVKQAILDQVPEIEDIRQVKGQGGHAEAVHFTSPFAAPGGDGWLRAAALADLPDGATSCLELSGRSILLSRFGDAVTCFENACAHMGLPLDAGEIADGLITCPHHGFRYALASGACLTAPALQLQPHAVRVVGGRVEIRLAS